MDLINAINGLVALFGGSGVSPREALIMFVLNAMLNPYQPDLFVQDYYDKMSLFASIAVLGIGIETIYRLWRAAHGKDAGREFREWGISAGFLFVLVGSLPIVLMGTQTGFNSFGRWLALALSGSNDPSVLFKDISTLSGNPGLDFFLSIVQVMFVFIFSMTLVILPIFLYSSGCLLIVGVGLRWVGEPGAALFRFSLSITIYALVGNALNMMLFGILAAAAKQMYKNNLFSYALANTAIFCISAITTVVLLWMFKHQISGLVASASNVVQRGGQKVKTGVQRMRGAGDRQISDAVATKTQRISSTADTTNRSDAGKFKKDSASQSSAVLTEERPPEAFQGRNSTASRSRSRISDAADLATSTAAAWATRTPGAILNAGRAAQKFVRKDSPNELPQPAPVHNPPTSGPSVQPKPPPVPAPPNRPPASTASNPPQTGPTIPRKEV